MELLQLLIIFTISSIYSYGTTVNVVLIYLLFKISYSQFNGFQDGVLDLNKIIMGLIYFATVLIIQICNQVIGIVKRIPILRNIYWGYISLNDCYIVTKRKILNKLSSMIMCRVVKFTMSQYCKGGSTPKPGTTNQDAMELLDDILKDRS